MTKERWRDVVGYEDYFQISDHGRLWSKRSSKILKTRISKKGYVEVSTKIGGRKGKSVLLRVHRLVAEAFLPEPSEEIKIWAEGTHYGIVFVNHKDTVKSNNYYENLEWCTNAENIQHGYDNGLNHSLTGCDVPTSKLSVDDVRFIRDNYTPYSTNHGTRALGRKFNVSHDVIQKVIKRTGYRNIE